MVQEAKEPKTIAQKEVRTPARFPVAEIISTLGVEGDPGKT